MPEAQTFVIVGASLAGAKAAEALRDQGFDGQIVLIGDELELPYERPPLSKDYLMGKSEQDKVFVHDADWYRDQRIDLRLGITVTGIDRARRAVTLDGDDDDVHYDKLLLTTGSRPRTIALAGPEVAGVYYLRRLADADRLRELFAQIKSLIVIGAGWIGLEVTAAAREAGVAVTVLEAAELPLLRVLGREVAEVFAGLHREHGVDLRFGAQVHDILTCAGRACGVRLNDGTEIEADALLVGVGVIPNTELAAEAGLTVDNGLLVDAALRSSDPDIFAAGDIARAFHPTIGTHIRVEHWANALNQPPVAAASMMGGEAAFDELPYFFTDQYDLGMEYHGYVEPGEYDEVVFRGDVPGREFIVFWVGKGRVLAGMNVNVWDVGDQVKALIRAQNPVDLTRLADVNVPLDDLLQPVDPR